MGARFGTEDWARALVEEINGSSEYRNAARTWGEGFNGNMLFVFEPDGSLPQRQQLLIRLSGGDCHGAEFIGDDGHEEPGFTLRAPFDLWKQILERKTLASTAMLTGKLAVTGNKMTLLKNTAAKRALIHCAASVETDWNDQTGSG